MEKTVIGRRQLLRTSALLLASFGSVCAGSDAFSGQTREKEMQEVNPPEDLMREHGALRRILLIYRHFIQDLDAGAEIPWGRLDDAAAIIRSFVEDYHEKLEEQYVFPAMRKAGKLVDLVAVLLQQHKAGRRLTDMTMEIAKRQGTDQTDRKRLRTCLGQFIGMYEPHAAREDTVLFPQLHIVWRGKEFGKMGDLFEKDEDRLFGERGFQMVVERVAGVEKEMGIYELRQFTPKV